MKKIQYIILCVAASLAMSGCIKETRPQGSTQVAAQVGVSEFALSGLINSIAGQMTEFNAIGFYSTYDDQIDFGLPAVHLMTEYMLEDCVALGEPGYNQFYYFYYNLYQGSKYYLCAYFWNYYYTWVKACNDAINLIGVPQTNTTRKYLGQAYAWRAYCYLDMARLYEAKENKYTDVSAVKGLTVPIVDENATEETARNNPRVARKEMYDFIISDLQKALEYIPASENDYKQPSLAVVYGLLARAYIEKGYWEEDTDESFLKAADYARQAITISGATPLTQDEWEDPTNGFNNGSANNSWLLGLTLDSQNTDNLCNYTAMFSGECLFGYGPYINVGIMPTTYAKIPDNDFRKHSWLDPQYLAGNPSAYQYKLAGSALQKNAFINGDDELKVTPAVQYQSIKFRPAEGNGLDDTKGVAADHCLMRVEELYFIEAEAKAHTNLAEGKSLLEDFMNYRILDGSYSCTATDLNSFLDELLFQKRIEFWGEGILVFDYKRLGASIHRDNTWPSNCRYDTGGSRSPQWNIVIPRSEALSNDAITDELCNPDPSDAM